MSNTEDPHALTSIYRQEIVNQTIASTYKTQRVRIPYDRDLQMTCRIPAAQYRGRISTATSSRCICVNLDLTTCQSNVHLTGDV